MTSKTNGQTASYVVVHETHYAYEQPVSLSRQIVHLTPRNTSWQVCHRHALEVKPEPEILEVAEDAFGNPRVSLCIEADHDVLAVRAESWVDVTARAYPADAETAPWDVVRARLAYQAGRRLAPADLDATRFLFESTRVRNKRELAAWTSTCFPPGTPLLVGVRALMNRIHKELTFDPEATTRRISGMEPDPANPHLKHPATFWMHFLGMVDKSAAGSGSLNTEDRPVVELRTRRPPPFVGRAFQTWENQVRQSSAAAVQTLLPADALSGWKAGGLMGEFSLLCFERRDKEAAAIQQKIVEALGPEVARSIFGG